MKLVVASSQSEGKNAAKRWKMAVSNQVAGTKDDNEVPMITEIIVCL